MVKWVCQTVWSELNKLDSKPAPGWTRTLLYSLAIKKCREKHTTVSGWETSSEAGLVMAQGRGHYLTHVRLPFKRGHGSSHHPLHSTRLRDAEVLQRERQVVTTLWHLRSTCLPPSIGGPSSLLCFLQSHSVPNYPSQLHGLPRHSSDDCLIGRNRASLCQHRGKFSFLWSRMTNVLLGQNSSRMEVT